MRAGCGIRRMSCDASFGSGWGLENHVAHYVLLYLLNPVPRPAVREDEWLSIPRGPGIPLHDREIGAHVRGKVGLIDDEEVAARYAEPSLPRVFVPARDI